MRFGVPLALDFPFAGGYMYAGLVAAFEQANNEGVPGIDYRLNATAIHIPSALSLNHSTYVEAALASDPAMFGLAAAAIGTATGAINTSEVLQVPNICPQPLASAVNFSTVISMRSSATMELAELFNLAYHSHDTLCSRAIIMTIAPGFEDSSVADMYRQLGVREHVQLLRPNAYPYLYDIVALTTALRDPGTRCIFFVDVEFIINAHLGLLISHFGINPLNYMWFSGSGALKPEYDLATAPLFGSFFAAQVTPPPNDADVVISRRFRQAMNNSAVVQIVNTTLHPLVSRGYAPTYAAFEGYIAGRMIIEGLRRLPNVTRSAFLEGFYSSRLTLIDDYSAGPFTRGACVPGSSFPCKCNAGLKRLSTSRLSSTTGQFVALYDQASLGEVGVTTLDVPLSVCEKFAATLRRPLRLLLVYPADAAAQALMGVPLHNATAIAEQVTLLRGELLALNSLATMREKAAVQVVPLAISAAQANDTEATLAAYASRYAAYAVVGAPFRSGNASATVRLLPQLSRISVVDESQRSSDFDLFASVADHIHALMDATIRAGAGSGIRVFAENTRMTELAVKSVNTFQRSPGAVGVIVDASLQADVAAALAVPGAQVLVATLSEDHLVAALRAVHSLGAGTTASLHIATDEVLLTNAYNRSLALLGVTALTIPAGVTVHFASMFGEWWTFADFAADARPVSARRLRPLLLLRLVAAMALSARMPNETFAASLYASVSTLVSGVSTTVGPFLGTTCASPADQSSAYRQCGCAKGPRRIFAHSLRDWQTSSSATTARFSVFSTCGVAYVGLASARDGLDAGTVAAIGGSAGVGGLIIIAIVTGAIAICCCAGRSHRHAPQHSDKPFAMVFTDIQSSTALWARAPAAMSESVDIHHRVLRECIAATDGYEVKTIGDSFMVAFKTADLAVKFSLKAQRELYEAAWPPEVERVYSDLALEQAEEAALADQREDGSFTPTEHALDPRHSIFGRSTTDSTRGPANGSGVVPVDGSATKMLSTVQAVAQGPFKGIRVRIGMNFGFGEPRKDPVTGSFDYYGTVVNTAARVEAVGHGGQVLATADLIEAFETENSSSTAEVLSGSAFGASHENLGPQPLRGLDAPIVLHAIAASEFAGRVFPPLRLDVEIADVNEDGEGGSSKDSYTNSESGTLLGANGSRRKSMAPTIISVVAPSNSDSRGTVTALPANYESVAKDEHERYTERQAAKARHVTAHMAEFMVQYRYLRGAFAVLPPDRQRELFEQLCGKWHVPLPKLKRMKSAKAAPERIRNYLLTHLSIKLFTTSDTGRIGRRRSNVSQCTNRVHSICDGTDSQFLPSVRNGPTIGQRQASQIRRPSDMPPSEGGSTGKPRPTWNVLSDDAGTQVQSVTLTSSTFASGTQASGNLSPRGMHMPTLDSTAAVGGPPSIVISEPLLFVGKSHAANGSEPPLPTVGGSTVL